METGRIERARLESAPMRNRVLHAALRNFALEAAALLSDDLRAGAEVEFDVIDEGGPRGPSLYHYQPRIHAFVESRWERLRELPSCPAACRELGAGASSWLRMNGLRGEQAEPALQAMLERLYEDATSFGFPEERFERVYSEVEGTLYRDAVRARLLAPLDGASMDAERVALGGGLSLVRGELAEAPREAVHPESGDGEPALLCVLEHDVPAGESIPAALAAQRFASVARAMRLWAPGQVGVGTPGWRSFGGGRWEAVPVGAADALPAHGWHLPAGEERAFCDFFSAIESAEAPRTVGWALGRFEMGCGRRLDSEALPDFLLALRALLDATSDAGEASLALRVAALCAEEGSRRAVQRRIEAALALERFVMGGGPRARAEHESPRELVAELEGHLRALLRDVLCGYLDPDLKAVADDILLETTPEPFVGEIHARDLRQEEPERFERAAEVEVEEAGEVEDEPDTAELEPVAAAPTAQQELDGVTPSADWGWTTPRIIPRPSEHRSAGR